MTGIYGTYYDANEQNNSGKSQGALVYRSMTMEGLSISQWTLNKFMQDKLFLQNEHYAYALEGVILNRNELEHTYSEHWMEHLYEQEGETFFRHLRGTFQGIFYDKQKKIGLLFVDQLGSKPLYYYLQKKRQVLFDCDIMRIGQRSGIHQADLCYAYGLLSFGYSPTEHTPLQGITRLQAGEYLRMSEESVEKKQYHRFDNAEKSYNIDQATKQLEHLFRQAVQRILDKNAEYHLQNLMPLSAGLDSRMTVLTARELGAKITTFTFSQTGYYDHTCAQDICKTLQIPWHFATLDGGLYLRDIDYNTRISGTQVQYIGPALVNWGINQVPHENVGVIASGMLGDIVINTYLQKKRYYYGLGAFSKVMLKPLRPLLPSDFMNRYANADIYYLYVRGMQFANMGAPSVFQLFTETCSPFCDVDVLEFCMHLPHSLRWNYALYDAWILRYHPTAAQWLHNGTIQIGKREKQILLAGRVMPIREIMQRATRYLLKKLHICDLYKLKQGESMNPLDDWLQSNVALRNELQSYFDTHLPLIRNHILAKDLQYLYTKGNAIEQASVLTYLSVVSQLQLQF